MYNVDYGWVTLDQGVLQSKREVSAPEPKEEDNRRYLGDFRTIHHGVRGSLYYVDERTLALRNFEYDGWGVCADDVFVVIGDRGDIPWRQRGLIVPFSRRDPRVLGAYDGGEVRIIYLKAPNGFPSFFVAFLPAPGRHHPPPSRPVPRLHGALALNPVPPLRGRLRVGHSRPGKEDST